MELKTRFNIGDEVFFFQDNKIVRSSVLKMQITADEYGCRVSVCTSISGNFMNEKNVYESLSEIIEKIDNEDIVVYESGRFAPMS